MNPALGRCMSLLAGPAGSAQRMRTPTSIASSTGRGHPFLQLNRGKLDRSSQAERETPGERAEQTRHDGALRRLSREAGPVGKCQKRWCARLGIHIESNFDPRAKVARQRAGLDAAHPGDGRTRQARERPVRRPPERARRYALPGILATHSRRATVIRYRRESTRTKRRSM